MFFIALGTALTLGGLAAWLAAEFHVVSVGSGSIFQPVCAALSLGGFPLFGLSAAPTNKTTSRAFLHFLTSLSGILVLLFTLLSVRFSRNCEEPLQMLFLGLSLSLTTVGCVSFALFALGYDKTGKAAVEHCWKVGRGVGVALSVIYIGYAVLRLMLDPMCTWERFTGQLVLGVAPLLYAAVTGPATRRRVQMWCLGSRDTAALRPSIVPSKPAVGKSRGGERYPALLPFGRNEDELAFREWYGRTCSDYVKDTPACTNAPADVEREAALRQSWVATQTQTQEMVALQTEMDKLKMELEDAQTRADHLEKLRQQELYARSIRSGVAAASRHCKRNSRPRGQIDLNHHREPCHASEETMDVSASSPMGSAPPAAGKPDDLPPIGE